VHFTTTLRDVTVNLCCNPGGEVLPYEGYIGMCGAKECGVLAVLVRNKVSILAILVSNTVSNF